MRGKLVVVTMLGGALALVLFFQAINQWT